MDQLNYIKNYFQNNFNLNFDIEKKKTIKINGIVFPNFYHYQYLNIGSDKEYIQFEFCRILYKIFGDSYLKDKLSYYEIYQGKIKEGDIVFDCGSNLGIFAAYAASKGAIVYCFEPSTYTRHYLQITQQIYPNNIIIVPYGLSDKINFSYFIQYDNPAASRTADQNQLIHHSILYKDRVELITLDSFCEKTKIIPNFIKMDIEGSEIKALLGGKNTIINFKPIISFCIHDDNYMQINLLHNTFSFYTFYKNKRQFFDYILIGVNNINDK